MILLILTVCSLSSPERCGETRLPLIDEITPTQCAMQAQPFIARWADEHPEERVAGWRCAYPESDGAKI